MTGKKWTIGKDGLRARRSDHGTANNGYRHRTTSTGEPRAGWLAGTITGVELTFTAGPKNFGDSIPRVKNL